MYMDCGIETMLKQATNNEQTLLFNTRTDKGFSLGRAPITPHAAGGLTSYCSLRQWGRFSI